MDDQYLVVLVTVLCVASIVVVFALIGKCERWDECYGSGHRTSDTLLVQKDFDHGTYIIDKPGTYRLKENIEFNPHFYGDFLEQGFPDFKEGVYDKDAYSLGFFAAIAIKCDGVTLDLDGHNIGQSEEHLRHQRFFAVIELADQPFPAKDDGSGSKGPSNFGGKIEPATNVVIKNGTIGPSSHHGIHGNNNDGVRLEKLHVHNFEVAGIHLNGAKRVYLTDLNVGPSLKRVPFKADFSAMQNLLRMSRPAYGATPAWIEAYHYAKNTRDFDSPDGLPDGSMVAGIVLRDEFDVGIITDSSNRCRSRDIVIDGVVHVHDLDLSAREVTTVHTASGDPPGPAKDAGGAVLDVDHLQSPLAKLQCAIAKMKGAGGCPFAKKNSGCPVPAKEMLDRFDIPDDYVDGVRPTNRARENVCKHDIMHHGLKGTIGIELNGVCHFENKGKIIIDNLENHTKRDHECECSINMDNDGTKITGIIVSDSANVSLGKTHFEVDSGRPLWICNGSEHVRF